MLGMMDNIIYCGSDYVLKTILVYTVTDIYCELADDEAATCW